MDECRTVGDRELNLELRALPDATSCASCDDCAMPLTVLIVDDHEGFRHSARALLEADGFEVVGEAADGKSGIAEAERLRPQLILLDIQLPDIDGFEVALRLDRATDPPTIVLTSTRSASSYRRRLAKSERAFITKSELSGERLAALVA
jgi:DNA-binding NarL/FixJ family response regulator